MLEPSGEDTRAGPAAPGGPRCRGYGFRDRAVDHPVPDDGRDPSHRSCRKANRIHPTAVLGPGVELGSGNVVGPYAVVLGPCRIGTA